MEKLTERDAISLRWMVLANDEGAGLYGPTLHRFGREPECESLVSRELARRVDNHSRDENGYWITEAGLRALNSTNKVEMEDEAE